MFLRATAISLLSFAPATLMAVSDAQAQPFRKGPYLQKVSTTSVTLMWESQPPCAGTVQIPSTMPPRVIPFDADHDGVNEVVVDKLSPGHRHRYVVECGGETQAGEFATAPVAGSPFTFVVVGDTRSNSGSHRRVIQRIRREVPDFILGTGDMVDDGSRERQWQEFFEIERDLLKENVLFPSLGNHDRQGKGRTADNFRKFFSLPENSPNPERYYAFTYSNARFLILDSNAYSFSLTDQTAWIEQQLQAAELDPDIEHVFVSMHHPPYSISLHGGQRELRERWTPLYEKYNVTAVFSGHDHVYSRAEHAGIHYYVTGGGGAPLYPRGRRTSKIDKKAVRYFERVNHYMRVHVIGNLVEISAIRTDGTLIETVNFGTPPKPVPIRATGSAAEDAKVRAQAAARAEREQNAALLAAAANDNAQVREPSSTPKRFGFMGKLGAAIVVLAGGVLVWSLRQ